MRVKYLLSDMRRTKNVSYLDFFFILEYLHLQNERSCGCNSSIKKKLFHVHLVHSLKVVLCNLFNNFVHEAKFVYIELPEVRCRFSLVASCWCSKGFGFWSVWGSGYPTGAVSHGL